MDSSSDNCNLQLGLVKEQNTQDWVYNSYAFTLYFMQFNYVVGLLCLIELISIFIIISETLNSPSF